MTNCIDLSTIINKLDEAKLIHRNAHGFSGAFSIRKHSYLLEPDELEAFIEVLHKASPCGQICTDMHLFHFMQIND
jgi:hypothetical protein